MAMVVIRRYISESIAVNAVIIVAEEMVIRWHCYRAWQD